MPYKTGRFLNRAAVIFVLYYCFFTVSTLSISGIHENLNDIVPHIYLLELIGSRITEHPADHGAQQPYHVPLLKKKAILPAEDMLKKTLVKTQSAGLQFVVLLQDTTGRPIRQDIITLSLAQPSPFHSGNSPPCA